MREAAQLVLIVGGALSLLALFHLQLSAWIFRPWMRALYMAGAKWAAVGWALRCLAWVGACSIAGVGLWGVLGWLPYDLGLLDATEGYKDAMGHVATWLGVATGSGWVWSTLQVGRRNAIGQHPVS